MTTGGPLPTRVGIIGTGRMGFPIAQRLLAAGFAVTAFDADLTVEPRLHAAGIATAPNADVVAASVEVLLTVLPDGDAVHASRSSLSALRPGSVWVDLSSADPTLAEEDQAWARARGVRTVSAPMAGGPHEAANGDLGFFVSGERVDVAAALPVLARLGPAGKRTIVGIRPGDGPLVKLLANLLWFGQLIAATEALLLGARAGIDVAVLRDALGGSAGGSAFLDRHLDLLLAGDYLTDFPLDRCVDELRIITRLAGEAGTPHELAGVVTGIHERALERFGPVLGEMLAARLLEEQAGLELRA
jgi:3-hydroxyisobutyrate dehydrogenase